jgi:hypothetical protein
MSNKPLSKPEQELVNQLKDAVFKLSCFTCIDKLKDFNDCRETGIKKDKRLKEIKDEEVKYYEVTKGCYDEYQTYYSCIKSSVNTVTQQKEVLQLFMSKKRVVSFTKNELNDILLGDYKLI